MYTISRLKMKNFEKLKAKWYKKLAESKFVDIENADGSLKAPIDPRTIAYALRDKEARETYYSTAKEFLRTHEFEDIILQNIWIEHCEGTSYRKIAKKLKLTFYRVSKAISYMKELAGL